MANQQVALEIVAKDLATATVARVNTAITAMTANVATRMSMVTSGTAKWEEGLRRLAVTQGSTSTAASARHVDGLRKASSAITALAGDAIGAHGKVAKLAEGLLTFGVGGPIVAGVAAGIVAVTAALSVFTKQAREAHEAYEKYMASLQMSKSPLAVVGAELDEARLRLEELERVARSGSGGLIARPQDLDKERAHVAALEAQYRGLYETVQGDAARQAELTAAREREKALREQAEARRRAEDRRKQQEEDLYFQGKLTRPADILPVAHIEPLRPDEVLKTRRADFEDLTQQVTTQTPILTEHINRIDAALGELGLSMADIGYVMAKTFTDAVAGAENFADATVGAVKKMVKNTARHFGQEQMAKAASKFAEAIWPPNPAALASALKHVFAGSLFFAIAGGGGGSAGGGGAGSASQFSGQQRAAGEAGGGTVTVVFPAMWDKQSTELQDFMADLLRQLGNRRLVVEHAAGGV